MTKVSVRNSDLSIILFLSFYTNQHFSLLTDLYAPCVVVHLKEKQGRLAFFAVTILILVFSLVQVYGQWPFLCYRRLLRSSKKC